MRKSAPYRKFLWSSHAFHKTQIIRLDQACSGELEDGKFIAEAVSMSQVYRFDGEFSTYFVPKAAFLV